MIYRDLLKISIYFIAINLFVDSVAQIPEKIYNSNQVLLMVLLSVCLNFLIVFLLFKLSKNLIDKIFYRIRNYIGDIISFSLFEMSIIICSYYIILTNGFSLIINSFPEKINFGLVEKVTSIIISLLLLTISKKVFKLIKNE